MWALLFMVVGVVLAALHVFARAGDSTERPHGRASSSRTPARQAPGAHTENFPTVPLTFALTPDAKVGSRVVKSQSMPGVTYQVDTAQMACTCPDFAKRHAEFPTNDFRRLCKHLARELTNAIDWNQSAEWGRLILEHRHSHARYIRAELSSGASVLVGFTPGDPWLDVFARKRRKGDRDGMYTGAYDCFGFNVERNGWSYGDGPPGAREVRTILKKLHG